MISTDFKGPGHDQELKESIISAGGHSGRDMLLWHFQKCTEYDFAGWWIWSYQDQEAASQQTGIRALDGGGRPTCCSRSNSRNDSVDRRPSRFSPAKDVTMQTCLTAAKMGLSPSPS